MSDKDLRVMLLIDGGSGFGKVGLLASEMGVVSVNGVVRIDDEDEMLKDIVKLVKSGVEEYRGRDEDRRIYELLRDEEYMKSVAMGGVSEVVKE